MDDVWKLTTLMGRAPASDAGLHPYVDPQGHTKDWGDGGSGDLDVYLADLTKPAITQAYPPGCTDRPSFIVIDDSLDFVVDNSVLKPILAHEFMHVLQFRFHYAHPCEEYTNLDEATAQWAIDYVAPVNDFEHHTNAFLPDPDAALWRQAYDGWTFELLLAHLFGPGTIAQIYAHTESAGPWEAVDAAVPGGLDQAWPTFTINAWNQAPLTNSFAAWDKLKDVPVVHRTLRVAPGGQTAARFPLSVHVGALAREYDVVNVADDVGKLEFHNGLYGQDGADVFALLQLANGTWRPVVDWTSKQTVTFCRHISYEKVKKIVLFTTDNTCANLDHEVSGNSEFVASKTCQDAPKLDGTFQWSTTRDDENDLFSRVMTEEGSATLHLVPDDPDSPYYVPEDDGTSTFSVTYAAEMVQDYSPSDCIGTTTWSGSAEGVFSTYQSPAGLIHLSATVEPDSILGPNTDVISIYMQIPVVVDVHYEEQGSSSGCGQTDDDQENSVAPFIDAVAFHCEPNDVADGTYGSDFVGKWHAQERTFRFECTEDVDDGFGTTGSLTVTGQLAAT